MKKYALILATLALGASLNADEMSAPAYSVTADFTYASKYVFRGVQLAEESFQPSVKITSGDFYAGVWTNQPITNHSDNEIDVFGGYGYKLNDTWSLDAGATLYYYPETNVATSPEHTTEAYVGVNGAISGVTVGVYAYRDFNLNTYTAQANLGYSIPLSDDASLNLSGNVGRVTNAGTYTYYGAGANIQCKVNKATTFTVGANYASQNINHNYGANIEDDIFWFNTGLSVSF